MRKYKFDEYMKNKPEFTRTLLNLSANAGAGRMTSNKPRGKAEEKILIKLDLERLRRYQKEGKLQILSARKFRLGW